MCFISVVYVLEILMRKLSKIDLTESVAAGKVFLAEVRFKIDHPLTLSLTFPTFPLNPIGPRRPRGRSPRCSKVRARYQPEKYLLDSLLA